jgi:N-acetylmuramoyl-L-alanine amidase
MKHSTLFGRGILIIGLFLFALVSTSYADPYSSKPGELEKSDAKRVGDEIVACGQFFHTGTRVVLWTDPDGYNAYSNEPRFVLPNETKASLYHGVHYNVRNHNLTPEEEQQVKAGHWTLPLLQKCVDQFVIHYDVTGTSRECFHELQDVHGESVHFMLDVDGTIYQTLDMKERAWHATIANSRSVGVEIANVGAYPVGKPNPFARWYKDVNGQTTLTIPDAFGAGGILTPGFAGHPAVPKPVYGVIQGKELVQYDFTPQQYKALIHLTAALCKVFPKIQCQYPTNAQGLLIPHKLPDNQLENYEGVLGHYHIQTDKEDPGPAFQWNTVINGARKILQEDQ